MKAEWGRGGAGVRRAPRRGSITVLMIGLFSALMVCLAMGVDVSRTVARKQQLVNACDAAAIAGASQLPDSTRAQSAANEVFARTFTSSIYSATATSTEVTTTVNENVSTSFGGAMGMRTIAVSERTRIQRRATPPNEVEGNLSPWAVDQSAYVTGQDVTLKLGGGEGINGNFYALSLGGSGAAQYQNNIMYGYSGTLGTGDALTADTQPGAMVGPTRDAVDYRIGLATSNPAYASDTPVNYSPTNPRILLAAMVSSWVDAQGRTQVTIVGFGAVYLVGMVGNNVIGRFVSVTRVNATVDSSRPAGTYFGVSGMVFVE